MALEAMLGALVLHAHRSGFDPAQIAALIALFMQIWNMFNPTPPPAPAP